MRQSFDERAQGVRAKKTVIVLTALAMAFHCAYSVCTCLALGQTRRLVFYLYTPVQTICFSILPFFIAAALLMILSGKRNLSGARWLMAGACTVLAVPELKTIVELLMDGRYQVQFNIDKVLLHDGICVGLLLLCIGALLRFRGRWLIVLSCVGIAACSVLLTIQYFDAVWDFLFRYKQYYLIVRAIGASAAYLMLMTAVSVFALANSASRFKKEAAQQPEGDAEPTEEEAEVSEGEATESDAEPTESEQAADEGSAVQEQEPAAAADECGEQGE